jgi:hypothetical protein
MLKHPDHAKTFCECFGPCALCEEYRQTHTFYQKTREVPKSTSIAFRRLKPTYIVNSLQTLKAYDTPISKILAENSLKEIK